MPITLSPSGSFGAGTVTAPVAGEARSSASVRTALQQLLDMAGFNKAILDSGVLRLRSVASIAALKGVTGQTTGDHAAVKDLGIFQFDAASALSSDDVNVVTPTAGGGRWLLIVRGLRGIANGIASLDATSKVPAAQLRGQLLASGSTSPSSASATMPSQATDVYTGLLSTTLAVGDVWAVASQFTVTMGGAGLSASEDTRAAFRIVQPDTSSVELSGGTFWIPRGAVTRKATPCGFFKATQAGTHTLTFQLIYSTTPTNVTYSVSAASVEAHRFAAP